MTDLWTPASVCPVGATLGEGPVWLPEEKRLWFVDIKGRKLHCFDPVSHRLNSWDAPAQIGWVLPVEGGKLMTGLQGGLYLFDPDSGFFTLVRKVEGDLPGNRLNDATTDKDGALWFGSMDDAEEADSGRIYRFRDGLIADSGLAPVCITNGPAISPDGRTLYHTDTLGQTIHASDVGADGWPTNTRLFARIEAGGGYPDGPIVDAEGNVWTGLFAGWGARCYAPDGTFVRTVRFPVANVTKLAFGSDDLMTVYATTATKGLSADERRMQPDAGNLFAFRADVAGQTVIPISAWPDRT
ncbi:SMP-30/gluconolactonase/LRE family protein [Gimibacter soli]|uniref:SMP-30/gluconolactonase/LRE family protein n=1 Tax=Gimibacter soli TaxID=3024400 RepID=A0AAE9XS38_9PROT|nr:SMP-30/gluconolactonase/LRE family protein [Gimibacter soli]WCL55297.1 SMP-30/gluconolactonase/LRE family protein [Gimibacter soli]